MPTYLHVATFQIDAAFPASITATSTSTASEAAAGTAFDTAFQALWNSASFNALVPTTVELTGTATSTASSTFKQTTITRFTHAIAGAGAGPSLPFFCSPVVTFRSAQANKSGHGRWFMPPLTTAALGAGGYTLATAAQTALVGAVNAFFTSIGSTLQMQLRHPRPTINGTPQFSLSPIVSGDVADVFRVQRRRADKRVPVRSAITV